jgi:hypothetical protein
MFINPASARRPAGNWSAWQATNETLAAARRQD